jgi:hypothetical protein
MVKEVPAESAESVHTDHEVEAGCTLALQLIAQLFHVSNVPSSPLG